MHLFANWAARSQSVSDIRIYFWPCQVKQESWLGHFARQREYPHEAAVRQLHSRYLFAFHTLRKHSRPCVYQKVRIMPLCLHTLLYSMHIFVWNLFWSGSSLPVLCFSVRRHCVGPTPCSEEDFFCSRQWLNLVEDAHETLWFLDYNMEQVVEDV